MGNKLSINIFMTKGVTHFSGFKTLLFLHRCQILVLLSLQVSTGMIRWQLHKELIGIQHRGGGSNLFWGGRMNGQEPPNWIICWQKKNLLHQWLIFFRMHPTHLPPPCCPLALAKIPHHLGCAKCHIDSLCCHDLTEAAARRKKRRQEWFFFSFFLF